MVDRYLDWLGRQEPTRKMETTQYDLVNAIGHGDLTAVTKALESTVDVNEYSSSETVLHIACHVGEVAIVKVLLTHGADISAQTTDSKESPLHVACREGHLEVSKVLLGSGADVNALMLHKSTPLRAACIKGHTDIVEFLLEHGADVNLAERTGRTPLITAVEQGHMPVVKLLLKAGCDKDAVDSLGRSAVYHAVRKRYPQILKTLAAAGCDLDHLDNRGVTPLHCAAHIGFYDMMKVLLEAGCDKDVKGYLGGQGRMYTPMWESVQSGHQRGVEILVAAGADPNIADHYSLGNTLFAMMMSNHCRQDILLALLDGMVNVSYTNVYGYSALHFAVDKDWYDAAHLLVQADCELSPETGWLKEYHDTRNLSQEGQEFISWAQSLLLKPKSLKSQCRKFLRHHLSTKRPLLPQIESLPLPTQMKLYLRYRMN